MATVETSPGAVLIVAPLGKDAVLAAGVLEQAEISARVCGGLIELIGQLDENALALVLAEEALVASDLPRLLAALNNQPTWSDIPIIILTSSGGNDRMSHEVIEIFGPAGNVTLLERPLRSVTLVSAVKVALRARHRQHEVRDLIQQRRAVLTGISDAFAAFDREWRYTFVNDKAAEFAGLTKDEMIGRCVWDIYPDAKGGTFYQHAHRAFDTQRAL